MPIKTNKPPILAIKSNTSLILAIKVIKPPFSRFVAQLSPPATILTLKSYTQIVYWGIQEKQFSRQVAAMRFIDPEWILWHLSLRLSEKKVLRTFYFHIYCTNLVCVNLLSSVWNTSVVSSYPLPSHLPEIVSPGFPQEMSEKFLNWFNFSLSLLSLGPGGAIL